MQKIVVGNWKMHGEPAMARALAQAVVKATAGISGVEVVLCPPAVLTAQVNYFLNGSKVKLGGQDCHIQPEGAYTGGISAPMLKDAGCSYVIVGHSERRKHCHENNEDVRAKAARAIKTGLIPIICIGESEAERNAGDAEDVVAAQIRECVPEEVIIDGSRPAPGRQADFLLAYEPVWAIGSGKTPSCGDIARMHAHIISVAGKRTGLAPDAISVLYGGSVNAVNAREIMATGGVSGVLVGGASVKAEEFCEIIARAMQ